MSNNLEQPGYQKTPTEVPTPEAHEIRSAVYGGEAKKPLSRGKQMGIAGAALAGLIAAGVGGGVIATNMAEGKTPEEKPGTEAPVTPGESTPTPQEGTPSATPSQEVTPTDIPTGIESPNTGVEKTVESLEMQADLGPESLVRTTLDLLNDWRIAGADEESIDKTVEDFYAYEGSVDEFIEEKTQKNADLYTAALFAADWQDEDMYNTYFPLYTLYDSIMAENSSYLSHNISNRINMAPLELPDEQTIGFVEESESSDEGFRPIAFSIIDREAGTETIGNLGIDVLSGKAKLTRLILGDAELTQ